MIHCFIRIFRIRNRTHAHTHTHFSFVSGLTGAQLNEQDLLIEPIYK